MAGLTLNNDFHINSNLKCFLIGFLIKIYFYLKNCITKYQKYFC